MYKRQVQHQLPSHRRKSAGDRLKNRGLSGSVGAYEEMCIRDSRISSSMTASTDSSRISPSESGFTSSSLCTRRTVIKGIISSTEGSSSTSPENGTVSSRHWTEMCIRDRGYREENRKLIHENARILGIPIHVFETEIFDTVVDVEDSPCYLCARMRRGNLYANARELGCNKIALGHHFDDVIETILMSCLLYTSHGALIKVPGRTPHISFLNRLKVRQQPALSQKLLHRFQPAVHGTVINKEVRVLY